jgi:hypothetical protein
MKIPQVMIILYLNDTNSNDEIEDETNESSETTVSRYGNLNVKEIHGYLIIFQGH